jgi:predicted nucleic acid-binding protein
MTWVADTSWLYALVDSDDSHHVQARAEAEVADPVEIPEVILAETLDLIRYRLGKRQALEALEGFEQLAHFVIGERAGLAEVKRVWSEHRSLSFADACAVALALKRGVGLRSFDKRQLRAVRFDAA